MPCWSKPKNMSFFGTVQTTQRDVLNKEKCLEALASLRHAKWFQVRYSSLLYLTPPSFLPTPIEVATLHTPISD